MMLGHFAIRLKSLKFYGHLDQLSQQLFAVQHFKLKSEAPDAVEKWLILGKFWMKSYKAPESVY